MYIRKPILKFPTLEGEEWRPITEKSVNDVINGYYVSNYGHVCSVLRKEAAILKPYVDIGGYLHVSFCRKHKRATVCPPIHRVEMIEFFPIDGFEELQVNHIDGNKQNNNISNLEWCTREQNMQHAKRTGLLNILEGADCSYCTITDEQANEIGRLLKEQKMTHREIAEKLGVKYDVVRDISTGIAWKSIHNKYNLDDRNKISARSPFTIPQIEEICDYFQFNSLKFNSRNELFEQTLYDLFGTHYNKKDYTQKGAMTGIYTRTYYKNITAKYTWPIIL